MKTCTYFLVVSLALISFTASALEKGFESLFDGKTLAGWTGATGAGGYVVQDGAIVCPKGGGGNLYTEKQFSDFILRFEFKLEEGSNNGVGIRAPLTGDAAYLGMEIQVLDESAAEKGKWGKLRPEQYHGSIYDIAAARKGVLKPPGEWNIEEIYCVGRHVIVAVNKKVIVEANLNKITDTEKIAKHPGMLRDRGHIGFLGHGDFVAYRNIRIKNMSKPAKDNSPPEGFIALFNGKNLNGWKGLLAPPLDNPAKRAVLSPEHLKAAQEKADERMRAHWKVVNGTLEFDGKGDSLCTVRDYGDFEMLVDWKILEKGDSGIYLRGSPQVQIWDPKQHGVGSGGFFNNEKNPSKPTTVADKPVGEWNNFRIIMVGDKVHVFLNGELVVNNVTLENYWERGKPIYPTGQIELQNHGNNLWFKNVYLREIPRGKTVAPK